MGVYFTNEDEDFNKILKISANIDGDSVVLKDNKSYLVTPYSNIKFIFKKHTLMFIISIFLILSIFFRNSFILFSAAILLELFLYYGKFFSSGAKQKKALLIVSIIFLLFSMGVVVSFFIFEIKEVLPYLQYINMGIYFTFFASARILLGGLLKKYEKVFRLNDHGGEFYIWKGTHQ